MELIKIEDLKAEMLPELQGFREKQTKIVEDNPYIEIVDNKTFEEGKKRRTALLKGRTELQNQEKAISKKLNDFKSLVKSETENLIEITKPHEEKQDAEVKRYEAVKEAKKAEKERLEAERIEDIKNKISEFENTCLEIIQKSNFENLTDSKAKLDELFSSEIEVEEFEIILSQAKIRCQSLFDTKCSDIQEKESQRVEREKLQIEKEELEAREKALQDQIEKERKERLEKEEKERLERQEKERLEKEERLKIEKEQKDKLFEIKTKRLNDVGIALNENYFTNENLSPSISELSIYECDAVEFENILTDALERIEKSKEEAAAKKAEIERLEKENEERKERISTEKQQLKERFLEFSQAKFTELIVFSEFGNPEVENLRKEIQNDFDALFEKCLIKIENL